MKRSREPEEYLDSYSQQDEGTQRSEPLDEERPTAKLPQLDCAVHDQDDDTPIMRCSLPPHKEAIAFRSYQEYESHYTMFHTNRCLECRKNFPSEHLLGVHIEECHDPLVRVRRDRGEHTVSCYPGLALSFVLFKCNQDKRNYEDRAPSNSKTVLLFR
jgi:hypothetical protein